MAVVQGSSARAMAGAAVWRVGVCVTLIHVAIGWAGLTWLRMPDLNQPQIQWVESVQTLAQVSPASPPLSPLIVAPTPAKPPAPRVSPTLASPQRAAETPVLSPSPVPESIRGAAPASLPQTLPMAPAGSPVALPRSDPHPTASPVSAPGPDPSLPLSLPSERASYLNNPPPTYPAISRRLGEQGRVVIRVYIDERGEPIEADWAQRSGYSRLDQAAMTAVMAWRYVPAKRGEVPVAMWFNVPITFDLKQHKD